MEKKLVIFDIDGTLVDTNWTHVKTWQKAFKKYRVEVDLIEILAQIGRGSEDIVRELLTGDGFKKVGRKIIEDYRKNYAEQASKAKGFPKVRELFLELKRRRKKVFLASSARGVTVGRHIKTVSVIDIIDGFVSSSEVASSKPSPDIFEAVLKKANFKPGEAVAVGDSVWDIQAAAKAGVDAVGVLTGGIPERLLKKAGAKEIYKDIAHLYEALDNSRLG